MLFLLLAAALATPPSPPPVPHVPHVPPPAVIDRVLERETEILAMLQQVDPDQYQRLSMLKKRDPTRYVMALARAGKMMERAQSNPEAAERYRSLAKAIDEMQGLRSAYATAKKGDQNSIRRSMEAKAGEIMDLKQAERKDRLAELSARIEELAEEIADRETNRKEIIEGYVEQLINGQVDL